MKISNKISRNPLIFVFSTLLIMVIFSGCSGKTSTSSSSATSSNSSSNSSSSTAAAPKDNVTSTKKSPEKSEEVFKLYYKVKIGMKKEEVDSTLGVAPVADASGIEGMFNYVDKATGLGVLVAYKNNVAYSRTVVYDNPAILATFTVKPIKESQVASIQNGMSYPDVVKILGGEGIECSKTALDAGLTEIGLIYRWGNSDGYGIQVMLNKSGTVSSAIYY